MKQFIRQLLAILYVLSFVVGKMLIALASMTTDLVLKGSSWLSPKLHDINLKLGGLKDATERAKRSAKG